MGKSCVIVSCTARDERERSELLIAQSFEHGGFNAFADLDVVWSNRKGLSAAYNVKLEEYGATDVEFLVFVHDDVYIDDLKLVDKLRTAQRNLGYQIIGAAGSVRVKVSHPGLWHLMADRTQHRGFVQHFLGNGQIIGSAFGPTPCEVVLIDGLFMAVHLPSVREKGWKFNENYDFHHYDLSSCLDAFQKGLRIGVYPIHLIHNSWGLDSCDNPSWSASNQRFLQEYGNVELGAPRTGSV